MRQLRCPAGLAHAAAAVPCDPVPPNPPPQTLPSTPHCCRASWAAGGAPSSTRRWQRRWGFGPAAARSPSCELRAGSAAQQHARKGGTSTALPTHDAPTNKCTSRALWTSLRHAFSVCLFHTQPCQYESAVDTTQPQKSASPALPSRQLARCVLPAPLSVSTSAAPPPPPAAPPAAFLSSALPLPVVRRALAGRAPAPSGPRCAGMVVAPANRTCCPPSPSPAPPAALLTLSRLRAAEGEAGALPSSPSSSSPGSRSRAARRASKEPPPLPPRPPRPASWGSPLGPQAVPGAAPFSSLPSPPRLGLPFWPPPRASAAAASLCRRLSCLRAGGGVTFLMGGSVRQRAGARHEH